jgi:hypothetical protein
MKCFYLKYFYLSITFAGVVVVGFVCLLGLQKVVG